MNCAFGWQERRDEAEIKNMKKMQKLREKELKMKQSLIEGEDGDEPVTINIVRAERKENTDGKN